MDARLAGAQGTSIALIDFLGGVEVSQYSPVSVDYINPFIGSSVTVFRSMLRCVISRGKPFLKDGSAVDHEISGVIGLTGKAVGTVVLSLGREVAIRATEAMIGESPDDLNADVVDAIGELTNMIAGGAKSELAQFRMSLGLPNVVLGKGHRVAFPTEVTPISIPFECEWGQFTLDIGLCQVISPVTVS